MKSQVSIETKPKVIFVGAFPPSQNKIYGGNVTDCRALMQSSFPNRLNLDLLDSTQISNPPPSFLVRLKLASKRVLLFLNKFEAKKPDCVLLFCSSSASLLEKSLMAWYSRLRGVPSLIFPRGGILIDKCRASRFTKAWVKLALVGSTKFLCQGHVWQEFAVKTCGFKQEDAPVIPNWTASKDLLRLGLERGYYSENSNLKILFVGWVEISKGALDLIKMAKHLVKNERNNFRISIAGDGRAMPEVKRYIADYKLEKYFVLHGWVDPRRILELYQTHDIFVLPSYAEGLPNSMVEAMASGLAVVVTPVGNIPDIIQDDHNGLIVPANKPKAMADTVGNLMSNPNFLRKIAQAGHATAKDKFSIEPAVEKIIATIQSVIKRR